MAEKIQFGGCTPLLNMFKDGAVVLLKSRAGGKNLRIMNDEVQGTGGDGKFAQLTVHVRGEGVVALQSVANPKDYVRIKDDKLDIGGGGPWCDFKLQENDGHVCFESVKCPDQHIGVKPDCEIKPPKNTRRGEHGQFYPTIVRERDESIVPGTAPALRKLAHGNIVLLKASSGKNLRRMGSGEINGEGGSGELAQWIVHVREKGVVALQNVKDPSAYLRIKDNKLEDGGGGRFCEFNVKAHEGNVIFESVVNPGQHVGIRPNGEVKPPDNTGAGPHGQYHPEVVKTQPEMNRAGDTPNMRTLNHMNTVLLCSAASGKTIRFQDKKVNGNGGEGKLAQFTVQVRRRGVIALRNVADPTLYLDPSGATLDSDFGGRKSEVKVGENDGRLTFESEVQAGSHIGILNDGDPKAPSNTGRGVHGQFTPQVAKHVDFMY